eukprot:393834-Alexandrium_andersonii.AAC.1
MAAARSLQGHFWRANENYYSFEIIDDQAILSHGPRFLTTGLHGSEMAERGLADAVTFDKPCDALLAVLRRVNVLEFNAERSNVFDVFKRLCDSIGLLPTDYINVYHKAGDARLVLWRQGDQRKANFPSDFRFVRRRALSSKGGHKGLAGNR